MVIISDGGSPFSNNLFKAILNKCGISHNIATRYHLKSTGQVEMSNREIKQIFAETTISKRTDK